MAGITDIFLIWFSLV